MRLSTLQSIDYYAGNFLILLLRLPSLLLGAALRRDHDLKVKGPITVFKILGGGSVVAAYPALAALRKAYPAQPLKLICGSSVKPYAEFMKIFDEIVVIETSSVLKLVPSILKAYRATFRADAFLNFELHSRLSGVFSLLSCSRNRLNFFMIWSRWQFGLTTHAFFYNGTGPIYLAYQQMASALGAGELDLAQIDVLIDDFRKNRIRGQVSVDVPSNREVACLAPFCSELGPERMFTAKQWAELLSSRVSSDKPLTLYLLGGSSDIAAARAYRDTFARLQPAIELIDRVGTTSLSQAIDFIDDTGQLFTIDSGLNHAARLLGVSITSYWGPTDPSTRLNPFSMKPGAQETVFYTKLFCSPCVHVADSAPCAGKNICMQLHVPGKAVSPPARGWINEHLNEGMRV